MDTDMTELAIPGDVKALTVDELGAEIRRALGDLQKQVITVLELAVGVGELLLEARERVPQGEFEQWLDDETGLPYATANRYMRVAYYKDELPELVDDWQASKGLGINAAQKHLVGLPPIPRIFGRGGRVATEADKELAEELRGQGLSYAAIGEKLGRSGTTIYYLLHPEKAERNKNSTRRRQQKARQAFNREQRQKAAKKRGGNVSEAYSRLRLAIESLDGAIREAQDPTVKAKLRGARNNVYLAEDRIAEALGVS